MKYMKKCYKCGLLKEKSQFAKHANRADKLQTACRGCKKLMDKNYYRSHSIKMRKQIQEAKKARITHIQNKVFEYLLLHPCIDCGENDIIVLEFDHQSEKEKDIPVMIHDGIAWNNVLKEIKKCQVRCANCHRRKTARTLGYRRYSLYGSVAQR